VDVDNSYRHGGFMVDHDYKQPDYFGKLSDHEVWVDSYGVGDREKHAVFQASDWVYGEVDRHRWAKWVRCRGFLRIGHDYGTQPYH
jgi:hypothetical protein